MEDRLEFEELYQAYNLCLKNKKKKEEHTNLQMKNCVKT